MDVDNLLGDPLTADRQRIDLVLGDYRRAAEYRAGDQAVVATCPNPAHAIAVELSWPGACHRRRSGQDGADLALLEEAEWAASSGRFERVVLGSGDRIFIVALDRLRAADIEVDVVARPRSLATALRVRAGGSVRLLPDRPGLIGAA